MPDPAGQSPRIHQGSVELMGRLSRSPLRADAYKGEGYLGNHGTQLTPKDQYG